ncbi:MAG: pseudouridine synthase [Burkholderiaceae bacterium]|nr:pseudouridine synthase [Burkholderiaceae bacterium]
MSKIVLFNKPFNVLTQFRPDADRPDRQTLADFIHDPSLRVAGRLDMDSEGLLLLTDDGVLNARITEPKQKQFKTYWVQVDGIATEQQLTALQNGVQLNDGMTLPAKAKAIDEPALWPRTPPVRYRANLPTSWLEVQICEGRNRQVRRMTAAVGLPTLRLIRVQIGPYRLGNLQPGEFLNPVELL